MNSGHTKETAGRGSPGDRISDGGLPAPTPQSTVTSLVAAPPPQLSLPDLPPDQLEFYVRSAIHQDRSPGNLLLICHPAKLYKFPRNLPAALAEAGFAVTRIDTDADRVRSVERIRDALLALSSKQAPLDLLVVSGDGTLDHHVHVAAFWAFYPDLVRYRPGSVDCRAVTREDLAGLPANYRSAFFEPLPDGSTLDPREETIRAIWLLRNRLEKPLRQGKPVSKILGIAGRKPDDVLLRIAILASLVPAKVILRPHGFDLEGLANATQEKTFQGLYPFIRSICTYPAGTAADNAVFAGVPGWAYGVLAGVITRSRLFGPLRRLMEKRVARTFVNYYVRESVVVPARISVVALDGDWQRISSHAAGGPAAGLLFSADLTSKTKGVRGYLARLPRVVIREGILGSTIVRIRSRSTSGAEKSFTEARISEALYTNRTFLGAVASIQVTNPTSFAGQSSLSVIPAIWSRSRNGRPILFIRSFLTLLEALAKGVLARALHMCHLGVGTLAGGGKFFFLLPEYQVAIKEGEFIDLEYLTPDRRPSAIPIQVSGDPFQGYRMNIRALWGPVPLLARNHSLLLASVRRSLADLRLQQSYRLDRVYIGGVRYFRHHIGENWSADFVRHTGLLQPPNHLPRNLPLAQRLLLDAWQKGGAGEFVDTTESGLGLLRRGRYAHNNDQSAHLLILRETSGSLLVRQVRASGNHEREIYETRSHYRAMAFSYIIHRSQTIVWKGSDHPRLLQEEYFFRNAETFQREAPTFFPVVGSSPQEPTLLTHEAAGKEDVSVQDPTGQKDR